ncbi:hypothetical protein HM1_2575 [Heliomicrobium modesticaldum Ice1]|uniref:Uncharacterized protein n=1 Tax=Heliobacterium modesticaldum (strain ATCC 51547 / Ice1) TaxID=498761 RepID=B0TB02_HELMI|nr:hypothetical protein [Heliomicrobium modesticaldum]ABZ85113.1 hypothetical protein HM1_2575 [Heliomicrobium modesticaldum Ice1]
MSIERIKGNVDGVARNRLERLTGMLELQMDANLLLAPEVGKELVSVRPAWALSLGWKSRTPKVAVGVSLRQGCPPRGGI